MKKYATALFFLFSFVSLGFSQARLDKDSPVGKLLQEGRTAEALKSEGQLLQAAEAVYGKASTAYIQSLHNLWYIYFRSGNRDKAIEIGKDIVSASKGFYGESFRTRLAMKNLGDQYAKIKKYDEAEAQYQAALLSAKAEMANTLDSNINNEIELFLNAKGRVFMLQEKYKEAVAVYKELLTLKAVIGGLDAPTVKNALAKACWKAGELDMALKLSLDGLAEVLKTVQGGNIGTFRFYYLQGCIYQSMKKYDLSEAAYLQAYKVWEGANSPDNIGLIPINEALENLYAEAGLKGKLDAARAKTDALKIKNKVHPPYPAKRLSVDF
jgi:tetratricopeptide (TPR) repeat protein